MTHLSCHEYTEAKLYLEKSKSFAIYKQTLKMCRKRNKVNIESNPAPECCRRGHEMQKHQQTNKRNNQTKNQVK